MTFALSPDSPRRPYALRFAGQLREAMAARGIGRIRVAALLGKSSHSVIAQWLSGHTLPRVEEAGRLAEVLHAPALAATVTEARTSLCANASCGIEFLDDGPGLKRYHSPACGRLAQKRRGAGAASHRADLAERAAAEYWVSLEKQRLAVARMCLECEPEGRCHMSGCALRSVSPLPLGRTRSRHLLRLAVDAGEPNADAAAAAGTPPDTREREAARVRAWHAGMSPQERAAFRARVSAGRAMGAGAMLRVAAEMSGETASAPKVRPGSVAAA